MMVSDYPPHIPSHHIDLARVRLTDTVWWKEYALLFAFFDEGRMDPETVLKVNKLLDRVHTEDCDDPLVVLHDWWERDVLYIPLKECGLSSKFEDLEQAIESLVCLNLDRASEEDLLEVPGVSRDTVSFFFQTIR